MRTKVGRIFHLIMLACLVMSASQIKAQTGSQKRALWVWGTYMDIILDTHGYDRDEFFSFVAAPHGNPDYAITRIFMFLDKKNIVDHTDDVRDFVAQAHSRGLEVELLNGEPNWSLTMNIPNTNDPWNRPALELVDAVTEYNRNSLPQERFDGIHMDIEPHAMKKSETGYSWDDNKVIIFPQFIDTMQEIKNRITAHNTATGDSLILGSDIHPTNFDGDINSNGITDYKEVQDITDQIGIMNYEVRDHALAKIANKIEYAEQMGYNNSIWQGLETQEVSWREYVAELNSTMYLNNISWWNYGLSQLEQRIGEYLNEYGSSTAFAGLALHYYEDIHAGETGYRSLGLDMDENHAPVCSILYPSGNECISGPTTVRYTASDIDGDALGITISYRNVDDTVWTTMPVVDTENSPMQANDGTYSFDTTSLLDGNYIFKVVAYELATDGISSYDTSDYPVAIVQQTLDSMAPYVDPNALDATSVVPATDNLYVSWLPYLDDGSGLSGYWYALDTDDMSQASFTRTNHAYVQCDTPGNHTLYIQAVDRCGNLSGIISKNLVFLSDMGDNDGIADQFDMDKDGDGVASENDLDDFNPLISRYDILAEAFEFDDSLQNSMLGKSNQLTKVDSTAVGDSYITDNDLYNGNNAYRMQLDAANKVVRLIDSENTTENSTRALTVEMWIKPDQYIYTNNFLCTIGFYG